MKRHLKSYAAPTNWALKVKENKFVVKPSPGRHSIRLSLPLVLLIKRLGLAETKKEVKNILHEGEILVDQIRVNSYKFPVGLMDVVSIKKSGKDYRVLLDITGKIVLKEIKKEQAYLKPCKIIGKTMLPKARLQLNLFDGRNLITKDTHLNVGDSVVIHLPDQKVSEGLKLDKGCFILLNGGKHIGDFGNLEKTEGEKISYINKQGKLIQTLKRHTFVIKEEFLR